MDGKTTQPEGRESRYNYKESVKNPPFPLVPVDRTKRVFHIILSLTLVRILKVYTKRRIIFYYGYIPYHYGSLSDTVELFFGDGLRLKSGREGQCCNRAV